MMPDASCQPIDPSTFHPGCFVCDLANPVGLHLSFVSLPGGMVEATFACDEQFQGYKGKLHGGVIATLVDGAMTHCLFVSGRAAVTAELTIRYRRPVTLGREAVIRAWIERDMSPLHLVRAALVQDQQVKALGKAKFMEIETSQVYL